MAAAAAAGDVTKDHVMTQLSALREQLNRLQNVKRGQVPVARPTQEADRFATQLEREAKHRHPAQPAGRSTVLLHIETFYIAVLCNIGGNIESRELLIDALLAKGAYCNHLYW